MDHLILMTVYALMLAIFFATLWRRERAGQIRLFAQVFFSLMGGALVAGWLMYFFPSGPPVPFP